MAQGALLDEAKKQLSDLKKALGLIQVAGKEKKKKADGNTGLLQASGQPKERLLLKTGKDTTDYRFAGMFCREHIERTIKECFTTYRGACLDTPVFERKDVLTDQYGEDGKLIFGLQDQGGEQAGDEI